jgi:hypothetical protein
MQFIEQLGSIAFGDRSGKKKALPPEAERNPGATEGRFPDLDACRSRQARLLGYPLVFASFFVRFQAIEECALVSSAEQADLRTAGDAERLVDALQKPDILPTARAVLL